MDVVIFDSLHPKHRPVCGFRGVKLFSEMV